MKIFTCTFFAATFFTGMAFAGPRLVLDTVATDLDEHGKEKVIGRFHVIAADGEKVILPIGEQRYAVTPTLRDDHTVDLTQTLTHPTRRGTEVTLGPQQQNTSLGEKYNVSYGQTTFSTKVSLAK